MVKFDPTLHVRTYEEAAALSLLMPRDEGCVKCEKPPKCGECEAGTQCSYTVASCSQCAKGICIEDDTIPAVKSGSSGPNSGAIAGGVVGGLVVIAILTYLVWRFRIKTKRSRLAQEAFDEDEHPRGAGEKETDSRRDNRSSVHTVHSIASTVLTRASNIIQIAYIPGVTNRATPGSPGVLVPPVPPIPMHASGSSPSSPTYEDQHFFTPGDLRDSTYSGLSGVSDRQSYARTSYHPRSSIAPSIASTIYGKNAVVVAPAQTGMRAKPAMISVKSMGGSGMGDDSIPAVPSINYEKFVADKTRDSTFSVGSTFLNNANTATATHSRGQVIKVGSANQIKQVSIGSNRSETATPGSGSLNASSASSTVNDSTTAVEESSSIDQGPFSDPPSSSDAHKSATSLSAVIEEATRRAAHGPDRRSKRRSDGTNRGTSPFSDEHAT